MSTDIPKTVAEVLFANHRDGQDSCLIDNDYREKVQLLLDRVAELELREEHLRYLIKLGAKLSSLGGSMFVVDPREGKILGCGKRSHDTIDSALETLKTKGYNGSCSDTSTQKQS